MCRVSPSNATLFRSTVLFAVIVTMLLADCAHDDRAPRAASAQRGCEQSPLGTGDVKGILRAPITQVEAGPADARTCVFRTPTHARIEVTRRPTGGTTTVQRWLEGAMPLEAAPLPGVGDRAAWQRDLHEVIAERNDVLCDVTAVAEKNDFVDASDALLESRLGELCVKVFEADP
jgi:hypothetical protein